MVERYSSAITEVVVASALIEASLYDDESITAQFVTVHHGSDFDLSITTQKHQVVVVSGGIANYNPCYVAHKRFVLALYTMRCNVPQWHSQPLQSALHRRVLWQSARMKLLGSVRRKKGESKPATSLKEFCIDYYTRPRQMREREREVLKLGMG
ncbi:Hypothetical predicted protein [Olea europaea subsp. europaea]|uniref:Uncharacterized protein n=1 Tax=Olea europaea subsp. europaea TaxID=158383 RepID=A0A8S0V851_OLEEU|nr:Hypothetical predicted protein [Olea europaea subsp. europaea]